jgi:hypothetical protein
VRSHVGMVAVGAADGRTTSIHEMRSRPSAVLLAPSDGQVEPGRPGAGPARCPDWRPPRARVEVEGLPEYVEFASHDAAPGVPAKGHRERLWPWPVPHGLDERSSATSSLLRCRPEKAHEGLWTAETIRASRRGRKPTRAAWRASLTDEQPSSLALSLSSHRAVQVFGPAYWRRETAATRHRAQLVARRRTAGRRVAFLRGP